MALIVWLWWNGGNVTHVKTTGDLLVSIARLTGLLGAFSALVQVLLLARIPWIERPVGFDRLTVWHRWNGHACLYLVLAHVVFSVWGYAFLDKLPLTQGDLADDHGRHLPRHDHRHDRHGTDDRRRAQLDRDRAQARCATRPGTRST